MYIVEWRDNDNNGGWCAVGDDACHGNLVDAERRARKERELVPDCWVRVVLVMNRWEELEQ